MNAEIIYIHGAGIQGPKSESRLLLKDLMREVDDGLEIHAPEMPNPMNPDCVAWMDVLDATIHKLDGRIILIGHSLGASVILKYLTERAVEINIESVLLMGTPFWGNSNWKSNDFRLDLNHLERLSAFDSIHFFHGVDDDVVPASHLDDYLQLIPHAHGQLVEGADHYLRNHIPSMVSLINNLTTNTYTLNL
ncbi:MAG: alpha/beta fold hydrolase [Cyclobacteriaceae bacterium]